MAGFGMLAEEAVHIPFKEKTPVGRTGVFKFQAVTLQGDQLVGGKGGGTEALRLSSSCERGRG